MKTPTTLLALAALLITGFAAHAADFPPGSPKFEHTLADALTRAKTEGKPAIVVFSAVWCGPCQMMKKEVYPSAAVKPYHDKFVWAYLDTDEKVNDAAAEKFAVSGIPHIQFLDRDGKPVDKQIGSSAPEEFVAKLEGVLSKAGPPRTAPPVAAPEARPAARKHQPAQAAPVVAQCENCTVPARHANTRGLTGPRK